MSDLSPFRLDGAVPIVWRPPFSRLAPFTDRRPCGETLLEMAESVPDLPEVFWRRGEIRINDKPIDRAYWRRTRPKPDTAEKPIVVTLHLPLAGGGGGSGGTKQVIAIVAAIALTVATAGIGSGALAPILGSAFAAGTIGAQATAAAVGVAGSLAINALTPPPTAAGTAADTAQDRAPASASLNVLSQLAPIPSIRGTCRLYPSLVCEPLIELVGLDEVVEVVSAVWGPTALDDIRIGNVPVSSAADLTIETREGWDDDGPITLVQRQGKTNNLSLELSSHTVNPTLQDQLYHPSAPTDDLPIWHRMVSRDTPDEMWFHLLLPAGLADQASPYEVIGVPIRIRMRLRGTSTWINLPELHLADASGKQIRRAILFKRTASAAPASAIIGAVGWARAVISGPLDWTADSYFTGTGSDNFLDATNSGSGSKVRKVALFYERAEFYLDPATFGDGVWEIEVKRGCAFRSASFTASGHLYNGAAAVFFTYFLDVGIPKIQESRKGLVDTVIALRLASVWNEHPIQAPGFAIIAAKAKNRQIGSLSVLASGYVKDWDGSGWNNWTTTSNPAPHYVDILSGSLNGDPLPADIRDDEGLVAWRQECIDNDWTVDAIIDDSRTQDALTLVASCGYAKPYQSELYGVAVDRDTAGETPMQIFSSRNSRGLSYDKAFAKSADGFIITYRNRVADYEPDQIVVMRTGYVESGNPLMEQVSYDGLVDADKVEIRGRFDLDQIRARSTFYNLPADIEAILCRRGDLVGVAFDILTSRCGAALVKTVVNNGDGDVAKLILDQTVLLEGEAPFGVAIQREDGTVTTHQLLNGAGETGELDIADPFDGETAIVALDETERRRGSHVSVGRLGEELRRLKLFGVTADPDFNFSLTLVDEAPSLVRTVS